MEIQRSSVSGRSCAGADMEAIEQTLKCPVCVDFFTDPVHLPCGHNFCRTCIRIVWDVDGSGEGSGGPLFCPECQILLPSDLQLETNTDIQQKVQKLQNACGTLQEEKPPASPVTVTCDQCIEKSSVAVKSCLSCDAFLCSAHTLHHLEKEALRGHTLIEVTEELQYYKCEEHSEELKLFCQDDQAAVCSLCVVVGTHKGHQVVHLREACSDFKIQPNAAKFIGLCFTVQMDNDPKHAEKATQEFFRAKKWNILQWLRAKAFHLRQNKAERPTKQTTTEDSCSKCLAKHHEGESPAFGDVHGFKTSGSHCLQRILNKKVLEEREGQLLKRRHEAERAMQDLDPLFLEATRTAEAYRVKITEKYRHMKALLEKDEQLMMDIIETEEFYTNRWLQSKRESYESHIKDINSLLSASQSLFQEHNDVKFLQKLRTERLGSKMELGPLLLVEREYTTSHRMETVQQLADSLCKAVSQSTERLWLRAIHLDEDTAHPNLKVSSDMLEVRWTKQANKEEGEAEQTHSEYSILAKETFSNGCHYWEVAVWEKPYWLIGLSYGPDTRAEERDTFTSCNILNKAFCYIYHGNGKYLFCNGSEENVLTIGLKIQKLGVWVDFQRGTMSFYDADTLKLVHSFTVDFLGPVYPIFNPCIDLNEQNMQPLVLFSLRSRK